jgi:bifunctional non-homologous end joining protein LigD
VEVKFAEWTREGRLRHPTYVGMRDDVPLGAVRVEPDATLPTQNRAWLQGRSSTTTKPRVVAPEAPGAEALVAQLDAIEHGRDEGALALPGGARLHVSHLRKVFWPQGAVTKGDLFRHYVRVAPVLLPVLADRPLVMRRYPNGVEGKDFYQHRAPEPAPPGVRVDTPDDVDDRRPHLIGGSLATLLYCTQLAAVSQDPWLSRLGTEGCPDHVALDLDPPEGLPFARVLDVARWIRDELDRLGTAGFPKTSGAGGLHVYVPVPPGTSYESGQLFCRIVATLIARRHPTTATVERKVAARGRRIYVDFLQNHVGKTLASAYSARASAFAGVSTPLTWAEVDNGVRPEDFTVRTFAARLAAAGDLWAGLRRSPPADLRAVLEKMGSEVI